MTLTLAVLLKQVEFEFQVAPDYELIPFRSGLVQTPKGGLPVTISKRSN
jgi:hypothetical protein